MKAAETHSEIPDFSSAPRNDTLTVRKMISLRFLRKQESG